MRSMIDKLELLQKMMPKAVLVPMTKQARRAVAGPALVGDAIPIRQFPFRIGRESRVKMLDGRIERLERIKEAAEPPTNDIYLLDDGDNLNISREHLQIEQLGDEFTVYDRDSSRGTIVAGTPLSRHRQKSAELNDGDDITIGGKGSPYVYRFVVLEGFEVQQKR